MSTTVTKFIKHCLTYKCVHKWDWWPFITVHIIDLIPYILNSSCLKKGCFSLLRKQTTRNNNKQRTTTSKEQQQARNNNKQGTTTSKEQQQVRNNNKQGSEDRKCFTCSVPQITFNDQFFHWWDHHEVHFFW